MSNLANVTLEAPVGIPQHPDSHVVDREEHDMIPQVPMKQSQPSFSWKKPTTWMGKHVDGHASFEEYMWYAQIQREEERVTGNAAEGAYVTHPNMRFVSDEKVSSNDEKTEKGMEAGIGNNNDYLTDQFAGLLITEKEKLTARRALRTASWNAVFFLIVTDILGPFGVPYAMSQNGYAQGNILFLVFGICAFWAGMLLWKIFLRLDSVRYPIKTYGDIAERIFGLPMRHLVTFLQTVQLIINVGLLCLTNGQALGQIIDGAGKHLCFSIAPLIFALLGMAVGQLRTLKSLGYLATGAVFMNIAICIISIASIAKNGPDVEAAQNSFGSDAPYNQPLETSAFVTLPLETQVNGVGSLIFSYGGAMIFPELMAELRRPWDFWKAMSCGQLLIFVVYVVYANLIYHYQGQYVLAQSYNGVPQYGFQTACNVLAILSGLIAALLYANVALKVLYINIVENIFKGPGLLSRAGHVIWMVTTLVYWSIAYIVGSAIPQVATISGLIAAIAILQFSYTFPFLFALGVQVKLDAASLDEPWEPGKTAAIRYDTWKSPSRWMRGLFSGQMKFGGVSYPAVIFKAVMLILFLASLTSAGLGMYSSGLSIKETFAAGGAATSFGCGNPV